MKVWKLNIKSKVFSLLIILAHTELDGVYVKLIKIKEPDEEILWLKVFVQDVLPNSSNLQRREQSSDFHHFLQLCVATNFFSLHRP
ncbi:hypothetical protein L1887_22018 [Cichorium endivia]|nr:hypothetical protein L1887_22018 [Cichorium endivia]